MDNDYDVAVTLTGEGMELANHSVGLLRVIYIVNEVGDTVNDKGVKSLVLFVKISCL